LPENTDLAVLGALLLGAFVVMTVLLQLT